MDRRPPQGLGRLTRRLAELLDSEQGTIALAQLQKLALAGVQREVPAASASLRLGAWEPQACEEGGVELVRSPALEHEWRFWADVERIPAKCGRRAVLLGESVARGYLYDPAFTPARLLEAMVEGLEVVDLARTDLGMAGLDALLEGLVVLEPDALVLLAGNNWYTFPFELAELDRLAGALREGGYPACRRVVVEELLVPRGEALIDRVAASAADLGVPVVVVVPEFNLRDWRAEPDVLAPVLPGDANLEWLDALQRAECAVAAGQAVEAARQAERMLALDQGTSSASHALLAAARPARARAHSEAARDAVLGLLIAHSPRCPGAVQALLRRKAAEHGFALVDLPRVLEQAAGGLPGRELFLDYCHLTLEGMRIAATPVAQMLASALGASLATSAPPAPDPADEALAHLLAALHNAHYGQPDEILRHHCKRALALWPTVADAMLDVLQCHSGYADDWLCASFERLAASPVVRRYLAPADMPRMDKLADFRLSEAILAELEETTPEARTQTLRTLCSDHGDPARPVDLLEPRYHADTFRSRAGHSLGAQRAYYRAPALTSTFHLVRAVPASIQLELTCRIRAEDEVAVRVNGDPVSHLSAGPAWRTFHMEVPVVAGVNLIELRWPPLAPPPDELERAAQRLERGAYPDVMPSFGEVHALRARPLT